MNRDLAFAMLGVFSFFAAQTVAFVLVPLIGAVLALPGTAIGVLVATLAGVGLVTDALVAVTSDRVGRRPPMVAAAFLGITATALLTVASDFWWLLIGGIAFGLAWSLAIGPVQAYITEACSPHDAPRVQGYHGAVQALAALTGALAVGPAIERLGLRASLVVIAGLMIVALLAFWQLRETVRRSDRPSRSDLARSYGSAIGLLNARPQLQIASLVALSFVTIVLAGNSFLPLYLVHDVGESVAFAGTLLAVRNVAMTISSPLFGRAVGRLGLVAAIAGTNILAVAGIAGVAVVVGALPLALVLGLQGVGLGFAAASVNMLVISATAKGDRALGMAANNLVARSGSILAPLVLGIGLEMSGPRAVFAIAGALGVVYVALIVARARSVAATERDRWFPITRAVGSSAEGHP